MAELKFNPVPHNHPEFIERVRLQPGFSQAHEGLEMDYALASQLLGARTQAGLTQEAVAERMGTAKSAISWFEYAGRNTPSLVTIKKHADAVGCDLQGSLVPRKAASRWKVGPAFALNIKTSS